MVYDNLYVHYVAGMRSPSADLLPDLSLAEPSPTVPPPYRVTTSRAMENGTLSKKAKIRLPTPDNALPSPQPSPSEIDSRGSDIAYYSRPTSSKNHITFIMLTPVQRLRAPR
jgi:hypothetical protein